MATRPRGHRCASFAQRAIVVLPQPALLAQVAVHERKGYYGGD